MIERPFNAPTPGPVGSDVLSDVLALFHLQGAVLLRGEFSAPWALAAPESRAIATLLRPRAPRLIIFHIIAEGECWVQTRGLERTWLRTGDVVIFPHGHAHTMGSGKPTPAVEAGGLLPPPPWTELPIIHHGGGGSPTRIVCAYLRCEELLFNPVLASLPPMFCVRSLHGPDSEWFRASVRFLARETIAPGPGTACLTARMTELLFVEILRRYIIESGQASWLVALADRHLSLALRAIHARPEHAWTLDELARESGLSRSALTARFRRFLTESPMNYLTLWRLQVAAQRLQSSDEKVAAIAEEVGYGSEEAFSRAFKRRTGVPPAAWRDERHEHRARAGAL